MAPRTFAPINSPRQGVRGVTLQNVANVGRLGSQAMPENQLGTQQPTRFFGEGFRPPSTEDIIAKMTGQILTTAGKKYSGYPTATQQELAVLGSIEPYYALGEYAAQLAAEEDARLQQAAVSDLRLGEGTAASQALGDIRFALSDQTPEAMAVKSAQEQLANLLARNEQYGATQEGPNFMQRAADEVMARQGLRDASYAEAMAKRNAVAFAGTQRGIITDPATKEQRIGMVTGPQPSGPISLRDVAIAQATPGVQSQYETDVARLVAPAEQFATEVIQTPRYELAQQMATQVFGMDPNIAAATFTPQLDIDYMEMQRDLQTEQNLAAGIDPNASIADTLLRLDPSGGRLQQYQEELAAEAERKFAEGRRTEDEEAFDLNIEVATGIPVSEAAGDYSLATARQYLIDDNFLATVDKSRTIMGEQSALSVEDRKRIADNLAAQYLNENPADPVGARILLNILYGYTFTIPTR